MSNSRYVSIAEPGGLIGFQNLYPPDPPYARYGPVQNITDGSAVGVGAAAFWGSDAEWLRDLDKTARELPKHTGCAYDDFFRREQEKPAHLRSGACMLVCRCPRCQSHQPIC